MRHLCVLGYELEINEKTALVLLKEGIVYKCEGAHDLHLNPERKWNLIDVTVILLAVAKLELAKDKV